MTSRTIIATVRMRRKVSQSRKMAEQEDVAFVPPITKRQKLDNYSCVAGLNVSEDFAVNDDEFGQKNLPIMRRKELTSDPNAENGDSGFDDLPSELMNVTPASSSTVATPSSSVAATMDSGTQPSELVDEMLEGTSYDDKSDDASSSTEMSDVSWKPPGPFLWLQRQIQSDVDPAVILKHLRPDFSLLPFVDCYDRYTLWKFVYQIISSNAECDETRRQRLAHVSTLDHVVNLLRTCRKILVLTGAGVSVSCGIPDFRSRDGLYARLRHEFPTLPDPKAIFDINFFRRDPRPFFKFAREIYPGRFQPSPSHRFIRTLEQRGRLLRNYTQNIDTLEQAVGITRVITCHGSFATASCTRCGLRVAAEAIRDDIFAQRIPMCSVCPPTPLSFDWTTPPLTPRRSIDSEDVQRCPESGGTTTSTTGGDLRSSPHVDKPESSPDSFWDSWMNHENPLPPQPAVLKPDIVFFGEGLPDEYQRAIACDKDECDLLIVMGSSLKVRPVALIPNSIPSNVPQILINREPLNHCNFDVSLLGDCDVIIGELCRRLGWSLDSDNGEVPPESLFREITEIPPDSSEENGGQQGQQQERVAGGGADDEISSTTAEGTASHSQARTYLYREETATYVFPGAEIYADGRGPAHCDSDCGDGAMTTWSLASSSSSTSSSENDYDLDEDIRCADEERHHRLGHGIQADDVIEDEVSWVLNHIVDNISR